MEESKRKTGTVIWFSADKGYGFIYCKGLPKDIFFHKSEINKDNFSGVLDENDKVDFLVEETERGLTAKDVVCVQDKNDVDEPVKENDNDKEEKSFLFSKEV